MNKVTQYAKGIVGAVFAAVGAYQAAAVDGTVTRAEWTTVITTGVVAAVLVVWSSNDPVARFASRYTKAIVAAFVAAAGAYLTLRAGGVTGAEWQTIGAAFLTAVLPTWAVPNTTPAASPFVAEDPTPLEG